MSTKETSQLSHSQRNRLIRSTRKLGTLLGEVPTIELFKKSESELEQPPMSVEFARPSITTLNLTLSVTPASSSSSPVEPSPDPFSQFFGPLNHDSPFCRDSEVENSRTANLRRRKMAKLTRTFGEIIPPELVTVGDMCGGGLEIDSTGGIKPRLRRYNSLKLSRKSSDSESKSPRSSFSKDLTPSSSQTSLINDHTPSQPATQNAAVITTTALPPKGGSIMRSKSLQAPSKASRRHAHTASTTRIEKDKGLAFSRISEEHDELEETHRQGREWSGEWNVGDMQDVVARLRKLK